MKEIKYEKEDVLCTTDCPYGLIQENGDKVKVGSMLCMRCSKNEGKDMEKQIVKCTADESKFFKDEEAKQEPVCHDKLIDADLYDRLEYLGIIDNSGVRGRNFGASDYNEHTITVWSIWLDYPNLSEFEKMMIKYILREKDDDPKELDLWKVIHYAEERLRQLEVLKKQNK